MDPHSPTSLAESTPPPPAETFHFNRQDAGLCGLLVAAVLGMFWKVIFAGQMLYYRDILNQTYPEMKFVHEVVGRGLLPYWNPYLNFGQPLLANPNSLFFYPTTLLIVILPAKIAFALHFVIHFALAAVGTYLLARAWRRSRLASFFAALFFVLSGPVLSLGSFYNEVAAAAWIPWALFVTDRALEGRGARRWVLLAAIFALQFLAGEPFTLLATFILCLAYAFFRQGTLRPLLSRINRTIFVTFFTVGLMMLGLVAVQLIPAAGLLRHSLRGQLGMPFSQTTYWSLHPLSLLEFVLPGFFAPLFSTPSLWTALLNFANKPFFPSLYVGFIPILLAVVACASFTNRLRRFAGWSALILLLLAFGRFTPVFSLAYLLFPPLELVRFPIKLLTPFVLFVTLLAGWAIDDVRNSFRRSGEEKFGKLILPAVICFGLAAAIWILSWLAPGAILAPAEWLFRVTERVTTDSSVTKLAPKLVASAAEYLLLMVRWRFLELTGYTLGAVLWLYALAMRNRWAIRTFPFILAFGALELVAANYGVNPTVPQSFYDYRPPVLDHFEPSAMPYRYADVFGASPLASVTTGQATAMLDFNSIPAERNLSEPALNEFQERLLLEHGGMLFHEQSIANTDVDLSFPPDLFEFWVYALHEASSLDRTACLFGRANVRYQVVGRAVQMQNLAEVAKVSNGSPFPGYLYQNRCFVPRAYVAASARYSPGAAETLAALYSPDFNPESEVLLGSKVPDSQPQATKESAGRIESFNEGDNQVTMKVSLSRPGYVVLLDRFDPDWHATLDGREVPILRADWLFRAVRAGAGTHEVRFYYRQRGLRAGVVLSLLSLAIAVFLFVRNPKIGAFDRSHEKQ